MHKTFKTSETRSVLRVRNLHYRDSRTDFSLVIEDFQLSPGELVGFVHPAALDRRELSDVLLGIQPVHGGERHLLGHSVEDTPSRQLQSLRYHVGWVQDPPLFLRNVLVYDNIALPLRYHTSMSEDEIRERCEVRLRAIGLDEVPRGTPPAFGYDIMRLASFARATVQDIELLVIENVDRIFLDREHVAQFESEVDRLLHEGCAVIMMADRLGALPSSCRRLLLLAPSGKTVQGTPEELENHPEDEIRDALT